MVYISFYLKCIFKYSISLGYNSIYDFLIIVFLKKYMSTSNVAMIGNMQLKCMYITS